MIFILKLIGWFILTIFLLFLALIALAMLFIKFSPVFGGKASAKRREGYLQSPNYENGKFANLQPLNTVFVAPDSIDESIKPRSERQPDFDIPFVKLSPQDLITKADSTRITWFGHSTLLLEIEGKNIMIDPMFSRTPSPIQAIGRKRYSKGVPLTIEELPNLDAVLITHDHYDHLDYHSIKKIKSKVQHFYVPLGISGHLVAWGVQEEQITELDWFETADLGTISFRLTPSHHYSGRSLTDRFETLWGGWIIKGTNENIYLSGDGGYGPHFKAIGEAYGPFDFAMIECGQYSRYWRQNHLFPEQTAQVALDVQAKVIMPIHWGAFTLAMHAWSDPVERLLLKAKELSLLVSTPKIGEQIVLNGGTYPQSEWWKKPRN